MQDRIMVAGNETYEFQVISSFGKTVKDNEGKDCFKVMKSSAIYKLKCLVSDVTAVSEAFNTNGNVAKNRCFIFHKEYKDLMVKGSYEKTCSIVFPPEENKSVGYYGSSK